MLKRFFGRVFGNHRSSNSTIFILPPIKNSPTLLLDCSATSGRPVIQRFIFDTGSTYSQIKGINLKKALLKTRACKLPKPPNRRLADNSERSTSDCDWLEIEVSIRNSIWIPVLVVEEGPTILGRVPAMEIFRIEIEHPELRFSAFNTLGLIKRTLSRVVHGANVRNDSPH